jgi:8-oxo-dGTP diphosphatase
MATPATVCRVDGQLVDGYVRTMRRYIGNELLLLPGVTVLVTDEHERILMVNQADRAHWSTVGGAIEPGESPTEAVFREALEETGLTVAIDGLIGVVGGDGYEIEYPNGDRCAYISIVYRAHRVEGTATPDGGEVSECRWVNTEDLPSLDLSPFTRRLLTEVGIIRES